MRHCPACGTALNDDARFCPMDGTPLPQMAAPVAAPAEAPPVAAPPAAPPVATPAVAVPAVAAPAAQVGGGPVISGRFQLAAEYLDTPTGRLHEAADLTQGGARVLVKLAAAASFPSPMLIDRAQRELRQLAKLTSPRILRVLAHGRAPVPGTPGPGDIFIAYTPPDEATELLDDVVQRGGLMAPDRAQRLVLLIGEALCEAQQVGVVHRNLAPHIIYVRVGAEDAGLQVQLADFPLSEVSEVQGRLIQGAPRFLAPEQAEGKSVDQRSNVFSLGAIYYYLLTGHPPFDGQTMAEVVNRIFTSTAPPCSERRPGLPAALDQVVARALSRDPTQRQLTLRQLLNEVEAIGSVAPPEAQPVVVRPYRSATRTLVLSQQALRGALAAAPQPQPRPMAATVIGAPALAPAAAQAAAQAVPATDHRGAEAASLPTLVGAAAPQLPTMPAPDMPAALAGAVPMRTAMPGAATLIVAAPPPEVVAAAAQANLGGHGAVAAAPAAGHNAITLVSGASQADTAPMRALSPSAIPTLVGIPAFGGSRAGAPVTPAALAAAFGKEPAPPAPSDIGADATVAQERLDPAQLRAALAPAPEPAVSAAPAPAPVEARASSAGPDPEEENATIPMPRMSEAELMATFGLEVPLRDASRTAVESPLGVVTAGEGAGAPAEQRATVIVAPRGDDSGLHAGSHEGLIDPRATASLLVTPAPQATAQLPVTPSLATERLAATPAAPAAAPSPSSQSSGALPRETAWFKRGEVPELLEGAAQTPADAEVSLEDHKRLSLNQGNPEGAAAAMAALPVAVQSSSHSARKPRTPTDVRKAEEDALAAVGGRSRGVVAAIVVAVLIGLVLLGVALLRDQTPR